MPLLFRFKFSRIAALDLVIEEALDMYAIIKTGGKQYRVAEGQTLKVEKLAIEPGNSVDFNDVLMVANGDENIQIGSPYLSNAKVKAEVVDHGRGEKIKILKFKRRKHHMKRMGHRQDFTQVKIISIEA
jgi:large subunit ribosomal protein L21